MSDIFKNRINQFLYNGFKTQSNAENILIKNIDEGNQIYEDLNEKFGNVINMSNAEVEKIKIKIQQFKNTKNKISNIVNSLNKIINTINTIIKIILTIVALSRAIIKVLTNLPIPAQFMTSGMIISFSDKVQKADRKIEKFDEIIKNVLPFINKMLQLLQNIQSLLQTFDQIIALIEAFLAARNNNFLQSTQQINIPLQNVSVPNSNIIGHYNGFTFELRIENDPKFQIGEIKRNYAVAIDSHGIERLKSQPSFASDPNVLIDELKFLIDTQQIKA